MRRRRVRTVETDDQSAGKKLWEQENNRWSRIVPLSCLRWHTSHQWLLNLQAWQNHLQEIDARNPSWVTSTLVLQHSSRFIYISLKISVLWRWQCEKSSRLSWERFDLWLRKEWQWMETAELKQHAPAVCAGLWRLLRNCKDFHCVTDIRPLCHGCPGSSLTSARLICLRTAWKQEREDEMRTSTRERKLILLVVSYELLLSMWMCMWVTLVSIVQNFASACACLRLRLTMRVRKMGVGPFFC